MKFKNTHGKIINNAPEPEPKHETTIIDEEPNIVPEEGLQKSAERLDEHLSETPVIDGQQAAAPAKVPEPPFVFKEEVITPVMPVTPEPKPKPKHQHKKRKHSKKKRRDR